jgi:tetratricopeptide (TPR) repeat protein
VADEIERWSAELARDPSSGVFIPLADALRRRGQLDLATRVATRGLTRRPYDGDAHDLLARIWADRGDVQRAMDEWSMALQCAPTHPGALKGMGFACYQVGRTADAERYLMEAAAADPDDPSTRAALVRVRYHTAAAQRPVAVQETNGNAGGPAHEGVDKEEVSPERHATPPVAQQESTPAANGSAPIDPRMAFDDVLEGAERAALVVDGDGLVLAGSYVIADGRDVAPEIGAALSGVSDEARRAMRHLNLGAWSSLIFETGDATVGMAPVSVGLDTTASPANGSANHGAPNGVAFVAAGSSVPLGLVRRLLGRVVGRAQEWFGSPEGGDRR